MKVGAAFPSKYLKADDLEDRDWSVTIKNVLIENIGQGEKKEEKLIIYFRELDKGLVTNRTNANIIEKLYGDETDEWIGKPVTLWPNHDVEFKGEIVSAIRIRSKAPQMSKAVPVKPEKTAPKLTAFQNLVMEMILEKADGDMMQVEAELKRLAGIAVITDLDDELGMEVVAKFKAEKKGRK